MSRGGPLRKSLIASVAVLLVAASCTGGSEDLRTPQIGTDAPPVAGARDAPGRLLVLGTDGRLRTMLPDGTEVIEIAQPDAPDVRLLQPTWSPNGERLAWAHVGTAGAVPSASLVTSRSDGTGRTEAPTEVAAFYLYWDPTSSRVAYLGNLQEELQLGIVDVAAGGDRSVPLDTGRPYYFSWAPGGDRMLVHVGADRLDELGIDGSTTAVAERPGRFQAPDWSEDGRLRVYAVRTPGKQRLVVRDGGNVRTLLSFRGAIYFELSASGRYVAVQTVGPGARPLSLIDVENGDLQVVFPGRAAAFYWSPAGDRLLYLLPEVVQGVVWVRWRVWQPGGSFSGARFRPSATFARDYLPFFDQFSRSMSLWAPDGSAFVFPGSDEEGSGGIWVQEAKPDSEPVLVADGVVAAWSPGAVSAAEGADDAASSFA